MKVKKHLISLAAFFLCLLTLLPIVLPQTAPDLKSSIGTEPEITPQSDRARPPKS